MRIALGASSLDLDAASATTLAGEVALTANEVKVLRVLAEHRGTAIARDELLAVLGYRPTVVTRAIDQVVFRLRRKLEPDPDEPRWLLSEPNRGYLLAVETADTAPPGRDQELALLQRLLGEHRTVWVCGLPGSGRHALASAAAPAPGQRVLVEDQPPPGAPHVRLGPLPVEVGLALLEQRVVASRGAVLSAEDRVHLPRLLAAADGLPGRLEEGASGALLRPLSEVHLAPDPRVRDLLDRLPALRAALAHCAVFPDPFLAEEAVALGLSETVLAEAWRVGLLEHANGRLTLPATVRSWLTAAPEQVAAALEVWLPRVLAAATAVSERGSEHDDAALLAWRDRLRDRIGLDARWLPVHHALLMLYVDPGPIPPDPGPWGDAAASRRLWQQGNLPVAQVHARRAAHADLPPGVRAGALRLLAGVDGERPELDAAALVASHSTPVTRGTAHMLTGVVHLQSYVAPAQAEAALLAAVGEFRSVGNARLAKVAAFNLAVCAARDGRARESLGWLGTPQTRHDRWLPIVLHLALEELDAAEALLDLQAADGVSPRLPTVFRSAVSLIRGDAGAAVAGATQARHLPIQGVDRVFWVRPAVAALAHVSLGQAALALDALEEPDPATAAPDLAALTRAVVLARCGRKGEAQESLAAADQGTDPGWRSHARALAAAIVEERPERLPDLRAAYLASPSRHGWFALTWAAITTARPPRVG